MSRVLVAICLLVSACTGTTGSALVELAAQAGGTGAAPGVAFTTGSGFSLVLDRARLHLGAVYLNENVPLSGGGEGGCVLPGIYVAEAFGPLDLDLLSTAIVPFPTRAHGTETQARTAEVWLLEGDIGREDDTTVILDVAGTATRGPDVYPFSAAVTIGQNRALPAQSAALPGANPICRQRIVTPIAIDLLPVDGKTLSLRVDPRPIFDGVDFTLATKVSDAPPAYVIPDEKGGVGDQLFRGLRRNAGVYRFSID